MVHKQTVAEEPLNYKSLIAACIEQSVDVLWNEYTNNNTTIWNDHGFVIRIQTTTRFKKANLQPLYKFPNKSNPNIQLLRIGSLV